MRIRRHRGDQSPADRIAHLASSAGEPIDEVLREVADFRLALETDLIIAAAAVDADELGLAADVVDGDRAGLVAFQDRMLSRLVDVARDRDAGAARPPASRARVRVLAAAAGLVALLGGGAAVTGGTAEETSSTEQVALELADEQLSTLTGQIVRDASTAEISTAASELHQTLETLITEHAVDDPEVAALIAELIREEEQLLRVETTPAARSVLRDMARLVRRLKRVAPPAVVATLPPVAPESSPAAASPKPTPKASPKPTPKASTSPSPSPSRSSSASPRPSASRSSEGDGGSSNPIPTSGP